MNVVMKIIHNYGSDHAGLLSPRDDSIVYFQIMSSLTRYCQEAMEGLGHASYPKLRDGYVSLSRLYGIANPTANRLALMAAMFHDKSSAHEAFGAVATRDTSVWANAQFFEGARSWAQVLNLSDRAPTFLSPRTKAPQIASNGMVKSRFASSPSSE
jgi:hypothetical protein